MFDRGLDKYLGVNSLTKNLVEMSASQFNLLELQTMGYEIIKQGGFGR